MSVMDDFNRALFDRATGKYNRAQFEAITLDEWCALVEGFRSKWLAVRDRPYAEDDE